ncbi:MAG: hypothetical protein HUJ52_04015 [Malacoplasma sp.]|nr:hypothetical protein [Malacoplasma sp.]
MKNNKTKKICSITAATVSIPVVATACSQVVSTSSDNENPEKEAPVANQNPPKSEAEETTVSPVNEPTEAKKESTEEPSIKPEIETIKETNTKPAEEPKEESEEKEQFYIYIPGVENGTIKINGSVVNAPYKFYCNDGDKVTLKAIPNDGYSFWKWSNSITDAQTTITVKNNMSLTAFFRKAVTAVKYTVKINKPENGSILLNNIAIEEYPYELKVADGTEIKVKAVANEGYKFRCWNGGYAGDEQTLQIKKDTEITARFSELPKLEVIEKESSNTCTLSINANAGGKILVDEKVVSTPFTKTYDIRTEVKISALPDDGYEFMWANEDYISSYTERKVRLFGDMSFSGVFKLQPVLTINNIPNIRIYINDNPVELPLAKPYPYGSKLTIEAVQIKGLNVFKTWSDGETLNPRTIEIKDNITIYPEFYDENDNSWKDKQVWEK